MTTSGKITQDRQFQYYQNKQLVEPGQACGKLLTSMLRSQDNISILEINSHLRLECGGSDRVRGKTSGKEADAASTDVASSLVASQARAEAAAEAPKAGAVRVVRQEGRLREIVPSVIP